MLAVTYSIYATLISYAKTCRPNVATCQKQKYTFRHLLEQKQKMIIYIR